MRGRARKAARSPRGSSTIDLLDVVERAVEGGAFLAVRSRWLQAATRPLVNGGFRDVAGLRAAAVEGGELLLALFGREGRSLTRSEARWLVWRSVSVSSEPWRIGAVLAAYDADALDDWLDTRRVTWER